MISCNHDTHTFTCFIDVSTGVILKHFQSIDTIHRSDQVTDTVQTQLNTGTYRAETLLQWTRRTRQQGNEIGSHAENWHAYLHHMSEL